MYAEDSNAGFIPSNIWYSVDDFEEGEKIQIYTALFNSDSRELSGTISFFDKDILLGKKNFIILGKGIDDVFIDWTVTVGSHTIYAKIENPKFKETNGKYTDAYLDTIETERSTKIVAKKIIVTEEESEKSTVENLVDENTPNFIKNILNTTSASMEGFRIGLANTINTKEEKIKEDLEKLDEIQDINKTTLIEKEIEVGENVIDTSSQQILDEAKEATFIKPFKYIELFFLKTANLIFENKLVFYIISILVAFLFVRFIFRLFFS